MPRYKAAHRHVLQVHAHLFLGGEAQVGQGFDGGGDEVGRAPQPRQAADYFL